MPWRTVWAWWRPVGSYAARPDLSGDAGAEIHDGADGRVLVKLWSLRSGDRWFDAVTGEPCPEPADGETAERFDEAEEEGPFPFGPHTEDWALHCPLTWEEPLFLDGGRFLLFEARGILVVERNDAAAADWPASAGDRAAWGTGGPWFAGPRAGEAPLDAARLAAAFGADQVVRVPRERQPEVLVHEPTRELIATAGLPPWWAAGVAGFTLAWTEAGRRDAEPDADGLLHLGTFDMGYADSGRVLVHPETGAVSMVRRGEGPFPFARDTETFVRLLEAVYRFMGACWNPYPGEDGKGDFLRKAAELDPGSVDLGTPGGQAWEHLFASITELSDWGY